MRRCALQTRRRIRVRNRKPRLSLLDRRVQAGECRGAGFMVQSEPDKMADAVAGNI
jgi:hypothetical protein